MRVPRVTGSPVVSRFAPSPTGRLHLGHAYSAILNETRARAAGGRFVLRIEDIDAGRCKPEHEDAIYEDLAWLGLTWDGPVLRQSERMNVYAARLNDLRARGLAYRCFRTRADVAEAMGAAHAPPKGGFRPGPLGPAEEAALLAEEQPFAWRLDLDRALGAAGEVTYMEEVAGAPVVRVADPGAHGDVVIARKDVGTSYHLASVTDDIASGVTHVIRGADLSEAAPLHALLYALFGAPAPTYAHHALIEGPDGRRLAKRDRSVTLAALREAGATPADVRARLPL